MSDDDPKRGMYPEIVKKAVWACIQEEPTEFLEYKLFDPGAWPEPPISRKIVMRVTEPWRPELNEIQKKIVEQTLRAARLVGVEARARARAQHVRAN